MPMYTYRREDGTEFDIRQKFSDDPLTVDPETGQKVHRVIQAAGIVFKGSGFYVNDSKGSKANLSTPTNGSKENGSKENGSKENSNGSKESSSNGNGASESSKNGSSETTAKKDDKKSAEKSSTPQ